MSASPETYRQIFGDDLRGQSILEDLHARFGMNPYRPGGLEAQRDTDYRAGGMAVIDYIERRMRQATEPRQDEDQ